MPSRSSRDFAAKPNRSPRYSTPNICPIHEVSEVNGTHYMAMAFIEGKPLSDYLGSKKNQNIRAAVLLVRKIALALVEAHKRGIIHRDLKPANIMIDVRKEPIVMDFGLARRGNVSDTQLTSNGQMIGTPNYMPPEQVAGRVEEMGPACDIYSLGVLLYEMIAGRVPFQGDLLAILSQIAVDRPQPPSAYRSEIDESLDAICLRALQKKPQDRYESMEAFAATLGDYLKTPSNQPSPPKTLVSEVAAPTANLQPAAASSPPRKGKRSWLMTAGGAGALLLLGVIVITITNKDGTKTVINVPEGTETDLQVASGSKVAITQPTTAPEMSSTTIESGWHGWPADAPAPAIAPFDAEQAKQHQTEWAAYLKLPVEYTNSLGMTFVLIPPGEFLMGITPREIEESLKAAGDNPSWPEIIKREGPQHKVILTQPIYLGVNETTQEEYSKVMHTNPAYFSNGGLGKETVRNIDTKHHPVEQVSWNDAAEFLAKLNEMEKLKPLYVRAGEMVASLDGIGYRFPTEAEWEFASRSGTSTMSWIGDKDEDFVRSGWFATNSVAGTHATGELRANPLGLFDVDGNVWEWVQGKWDPTYYDQFAEKPAVNPSGAISADPRGVIRGGGWRNTATRWRTSIREPRDQAERHPGIGIRVALTTDAVKQFLDTLRSDGSPAIRTRSEMVIDYATERKVIERLLRLAKGKATLGNRYRQTLGELKNPLPVQTICILSVDFSNADLSDEELAALAGCRELETLNLSGNDKLTAAGLTKLGSLPRLDKLLISGTGVGNEAVAWLANLPALASLDALDTPITAEAWEALPPSPRLRDLNTSAKVGSAGLSRIAEQCPELRSLSLNDDAVTDLSPLSQLPRLRSLQIGSQALSDAAVETLLKLPLLEQLSVDSADPAGVARLPRLGLKLTRLAVRDVSSTANPASSKAWAAVTQMPGLLELALNNDVTVNGPALQRIATMPALRKFQIGDNSTDKTRCRVYTANDITAFRQQRPDIELTINGQTFPALDDWPGKFEGSTRIAEWTELPPDAPAPAVGTFSADDAKQKQAEWSKHLKQPVEFTLDVAAFARTRAGAQQDSRILANAATKSATTMKFRLIPPSEAVVNSGSPEQLQLVLQRLTPYYLGATEVTVGQFQQFVAATAYQTDAERWHNGHNLPLQPDPNANWKTPGYPISDDLPINFISPADAQAFCDWLNTQPETSNLKSKIANQKSFYRLPTELEWDLACRAGGEGSYGFAGTAQGVFDYAWTSENIAGKPSPVQPVATKQENPFGLHDVLGNVWEWYTTDTGIVRGLAGGAIDHTSNEMSMNFRALGTDWVLPQVGFRVLRQLEPSPPAPKFAEQPVLTARNSPLGPQASVTRPAPIPGLRSWTIELAAPQGGVNSSAWSPKGDVIATMGSDTSVCLWDRDANLKSILLGHQGGSVTGSHSVCFSPNGELLATVDQNGGDSLVGKLSLRIWNIRNGDCLAAVPLRTWGWCVAWSPDGKQIAYGGTVGMCEILDVATGQTHALKIESEVASLAWSADSQTLCVPDKGLPVLFDVASGEKLTALTAPDAKPVEAWPPSYVAWSPDGRWLAGAQCHLLYHFRQDMTMFGTIYAHV